MAGNLSLTASLPRVILLSLINTLQPELTEVKHAVARRLDDDHFEAALRLLERDHLIRRLSSNKAIVTVRGQEALGTGAIAKARDVNRLLHLSKRSRGGREQP